MRTDPRVRARLRRAHAWLAVAQFVHGSTLVFVLLATVGGSFASIAQTVVAVVLAAGPLALMPLWERRTPIGGRPARWLRRAVGLVLPHSAAVGLVVASLNAGELAWWQELLVPCGVLVVELGAVAAASRALRYPLSPELGEMDVEVLVKIREDEHRPSWSSQHDVRMTVDSLITTVRPGPSTAFAQRIELDDVRDAVVRRVTPEDGPWFKADGREFWPPAGDAVVISLGSGRRVLPVYDPYGFADVVRARMALRGS